MRHRVEPFGDGARELRLPAGDHLAHGADAARGVGLDARELGHALLELLGMHVVRAASAPRARAARASMTAMAPSSARTTHAKAVSASPTVTVVSPIRRNVSVIGAL